jgi:hypothetical protein
MEGVLFFIDNKWITDEHIRTLHFADIINKISP